MATTLLFGGEPHDEHTHPVDRRLGRGAAGRSLAPSEQMLIGALPI